MSNVNRKHVIRKKKLKSLERETRNYCCGAYYNEDLDRYIRVYTGKRHNSYKSYLRLKSNKVTRYWNKRLCYDVINRNKYTYTSKKSCDYRRLYDYWWNLY